MISILGGGSWGPALGIHLARQGHQIKIWEFMEDRVKEMQSGVCPLLNNIPLPKTITISTNMQETLADTDLVLIAVPSSNLEATIKQAAPFLQKQPIIICSKGFGSGLTLLSDVVKEHASGDVYALYGPTHAEEVCKDMFSGIVLAGPSGKDNLQKILQSANFKVDLSDDLIGVQVASALKNILAVFIGVLDGLSLGDNAKAYVMTRGLQEITQVGLKWGGKIETFYGLAGVGDIIVTCTSQHSRNRYVGQELGKGRTLQEITDEMQMVAEGVTTIQQAINLREKFNLPLPLISGLHAILNGQAKPKEILQKL